MTYLKKKLKIILTIAVLVVLLFLGWRIAYSLNKSSDNLPALTTVSEMSEAEVNSLLIGYRIIQLREVWGDPTFSNDNEDCWQIGDRTLVVNYKNNGKIAVCGLKDKNGISVEES